ncbi:MAG TPA: DUF2934 domain-containing protein [Vicinamibacterales bacterium]
MSKRSTSPKDGSTPRRRSTKAAGTGAEAPKPRAVRARRTPAAAAAPMSHVNEESVTAMPVPATLSVNDAAPARRQPTHDEIATRAYYISLANGFQSDPFLDWLRAERELAQA